VPWSEVLIDLYEAPQSLHPNGAFTPIVAYVSDGYPYKRFCCKASVSMLFYVVVVVIIFSPHKFEHGFQNLLWHSIDCTHHISLAGKLGSNVAGFLDEKCPLLKRSIRIAKTMSRKADLTDLRHI